jgi:hypothetical protein
MATQDRIEVHSSRLLALFKSFTRLLFPERMVADKTAGVTKKSVTAWYLPWVGHRQHLPLSHIANVDRDTGVVWDDVIVQSTGGTDPLTIQNVSKRSARRFEKTVNEWISKA